MCVFMMKVRDVRVMNAFSHTLCGNMFSTFAAGTATDLKEYITTFICAVQFASDVRVYDGSLRCPRCDCVDVSDASWERFSTFAVCT